MEEVKTAAAENAALRYLAYAQKCGVPGATAMLSKQIENVKLAGETNNQIKTASVEERIVEMIIEKYASEPKEVLLEMAKELGKILDNEDINEEDLTPEALENLKEII